MKSRILDIAWYNDLSHLGSYFSAAGIVEEIFQTKKEDDIFILSSGHAALALYAALEKYCGKNAEDLFAKHGGHPHRDEENGIYCSTGSLGMGITVAVGRALADRNRNVYVLISDGECAEGSVWEALRYIEEYNVDIMEISVETESNDIICLQDLYLQLDKSNVDMIVDEITSGADPSGSTYTVTPSYNTGKIVR